MISICMIVKNEASILNKSLAAIKKYGYEIVIVDTGSEDETKEIAYNYTDNVYDYRWSGNFSEARNFAISKAKNEFILMIDADEIVNVFDKNKVEKYIELNRGRVGRISILNEFSDGENLSKSIEKVSRVFSKNFYRYEGSIHEQLVNKKERKVECYELPIKVIHNGYDIAEIKRKDKVNRNVTMLKKELDLNKDDPYVLYQLGKTYYMAKDYINSEVYFNKAMEIDLDTNLEYVQDLVECYGYSLIYKKKYSESLKLINIYDVFSKSSDFIFLIGLIYMNNGMFVEAVEEFLKASTMNNAKVLGVNDYLSFYNIGIIYECLGQFTKAQEYYLKCGKYELAIKRMKFINKSYEQ